MWQIITAAVVLIAPGVVVVYDMLAEHYGGPGATITAMVQNWAGRVKELPAITAALFLWLWLHLYMTGLIERVNKRFPPPTPNGAEKKE